MKVDFKQIESRKQTLEITRLELKQHFIGIDDIIDELLSYIQIWYILPDTLRRPIIVNLWGMTGVGKTDLIRRLVKCLDFQDRFVEVELNNTTNSHRRNSVANILQDHAIDDGKPAIVLFDEIQRFNTIDDNGNPIKNIKFTDFWELLSDGKLSKRSKEDLDYYIQEHLFQQKEYKRNQDQKEEFTLDIVDASQLKSLLNLDQELIDISYMSRAEIIERIQEAKQKKEVYEPVDYSKTLILISGNLDDAFAIANQISESDIDADIFHAFTKKITMVDIKNALSKKFRPEQVARFGNIHLIYKSLRKVDFEKLIAQELQRIITDVENQFAITLSIDRSIHELIYRNGVFPVQGVRPVFSSIVDVLETNLSQLLFLALLHKESVIKIAYDSTNGQIVTQIGATLQNIPFTGRIDKIRDSNLIDTTANTSVHEAGHAVAYIVLFGLVPLQLKSKLANSYADGFTFPHQIYETKENLLHKVKVYLSGNLAEEIIFGKELTSIGHAKDLEQATILISDYIRKYGFDPKYQANYTLEDDYEMNKSVTSRDIEKMMAHQVMAAKEILLIHRLLLRELATKLAEIGNLSTEEVKIIAATHGLTVSIKEEGYLITPPYNEILKSSFYKE
jgi:hypothetical protein